MIPATSYPMVTDYPESHFWFWTYPPNSPELENDLREILPLLNVNEQCDEPKCSKSRVLMAESFARTRLSRSLSASNRMLG
jgi:hypothetical protein